MNVRVTDTAVQDFDFDLVLARGVALELETLEVAERMFGGVADGLEFADRTAVVIGRRARQDRVKPGLHGVPESVLETVAGKMLGLARLVEDGGHAEEFMRHAGVDLPFDFDARFLEGGFQHLPVAAQRIDFRIDDRHGR